MIGSQLSHYRITEKLGTGGMGEVYAAEDTKLDRKVAIKILPEDLAADPERRERFEREAKAIAALNHPNIVTIYSVEEADGLHFITMELVEGESLADKIPEHGFTLDQFFDLSVPMVEALDAAHKKGITHRDLKPNNVMVTDEGRVKVLDFGLAKLVDAEAPLDPAEAATMMASGELTEQGQILGTVTYMSPEQAEGKPVDHRSDIFSLGVVMYEMATGDAPFRGETKISVITSIMRDTPPPVSEINHELPQHLGRVINRSLAKAADRRYQSTTDLRNELEDLKEEIATSELRQSAVSLPTAKASKGGGIPWWVILALGSVVAVAALALVFGPQFGSEPGAGPGPPGVVSAVAEGRPSLAVLYFENLSGDESLDWLRTGLTDMLVTDLAQSPNIRVLATDRLHQILEDIGAADDEMTSSDVVDAVAEQGDVETVLLGSFARAGDTIRISARLQQAATGDILASETVEGEGQEAIFPLVDDLTKRIKSQFDMAEEVMIADIDADLTDVTTDNVEAYRYYAEGIRMHEELREDEAIPLLEKAVELDPDFAMALAKLATSYNNVGDPQKSREYSQRAMEHLDRVTDRERFYIEGRHYSLDQETIDESIDAYRKAIEKYPDHTAARNNLAQQLVNLERFDEAIEHLEVLRRGKMQFPGTYASLADAYGRMGRFDEGLDVLRSYAEENPDNAAGFENLAGYLAWAGRLDDAEQTLERAEALGRPLAETAELRWQIAVLSDDLEEAETIVVRLDEEESPRARPVALLMAIPQALLRGDLGDFDDAVDELMSLEGFEARALNIRGKVQLETGDLDGMLETADEMAAIAGDDFQLQLDALGTRAAAVAARDGLDAVDELVLEVFEFISEYRLPPRILLREERRFRGELAFAAGEWQRAISYFDEAVAAMPGRAVRSSSQRATLHYMLGVSHFELGDHEAAEENLLEQLGMAGRVYDAVSAVRGHWYLGQIYEQRGDDARARGHYQRFIDFWGGGDIDQDRVEYAENFLDR